MAKNPEHYAIVIGIDGYTHLPALETAASEAAAFVEWLTSDDGGGLPTGNVKLITSPPVSPTNPMEARPAQYDIDHALYEMGVKTGRLIGKRLYFYFGGHAVGTNFDDLAMLMAPASFDLPGHNIGLRAYRHFLHDAGLFEEIVFILDCSRIKFPALVTGSQPSFTVSAESKINVSDFLLLASTPDADASGSSGSHTDVKTGLLTHAALEGLRGEAADNSGRITSTSLSAYVQRRVSQLAGSASLRQVPEFVLPNREIVFAEDKFNEKDTNTIIVEVPHWSSVVTVYDNSMKPVLVLNQVQEESGKHFVTGKLLKGIYLIEVTLEGKSQRELVVVQPDQTTTIPRSTWKKLKFVSPAPFHGKEKRLRLHAEKAFEHSRRATWRKSGGSNLSSRLFLFVRTSEPQRYPLFHTGLSLKRLNEERDASGQISYAEEIITEFPENAVEIDKADGWMAFCADLEPGFYILQKYRPPHINRPRQHPIYLCAGWETQVFMSARNSPSLRKLSLSMTGLNAGFNPDDETAEAAEAVLDAIRHDNGSSRQIVTGEKITALLKGERKNPWLGILAAYALRPQLSEDRESENLFDEIISFLQSAIGDHPDVRALTLMKMQREANAQEMPETIVFKEPPLLRAGFKIVQEQALKISKTIPLGSLTERLIGKILTDTPWTAWRELDLVQLSEKEVSHPQSITPALIEAASYLQTISPKAPVIRISSLETAAAPPVPKGAASDTSGFESPTPTPVTAQEASLIKLVHDLTQSGDLDALEETYTLKPDCVDELLNNVNAEEISAASGVPLARTEEGLQSLREKHKTQVAGGFTEEILQTPVENLVLGYALKKSSAASETAQTVSFDLPKGDFESVPPEDASMTTAAQAEPVATPVTIEECVSKLKAEAVRIISPQIATEESKTEAVQASDYEYQERAKDIAERLYAVADSLLAAAAFTATTDVQGQVIYANGAFIELITPRRISFDEEEQKRFCETNKRLFGEALNIAPLGTSELSNPVPESIYRAFKLQRSEIREGATQSVQAYLNVLRVKDASSINMEALRKIDSGLSELRLYASLFAHGSSESRKEYYKKLVELVKKFQQAAVENGETNNINITTSSINQEDIMTNNTVNETAFGEADETELTQAEGTLYGREFWGISRHELIAGAAMELLSNRAQLEVRRILAPIGVFGLEDVAGWADRLKQGISNPDEETVAFLNDARNRTHGTWHYVNVPHGADGYSRADYPQFTRDDDVVQMIKHSVLVLKGESDRFSELNALRWLAHLVGDVHQPVHVGCGYIDESTNPPRLVFDPEEAAGLDHDRGGNQIQLPVRATLHSYWDSRLLDDSDDHFHDEDAPQSDAAAAPASDAPADDSGTDPELKKRFIEKLVGRLKNPALPEGDAPAGDAASDTSGLPPEDWAEVWATESIRLAREAYQSLVITRKQGGKFKVNWEGKDAYDARCKPIAQQQVDAAAQNLAAVLNAIWAEN